ncbi:MAG: DUF4867 family protein [Erysipelotrichaceae bacterium]|nr:DUF4867 family protein [Erysipelotrichaceae bacterium]
MEILSVANSSFKEYGKVLENYDTKELCAAMEMIALPEEGTAYDAGIASLEACALFTDLRDSAFGGMPIQIGMCYGRNTKLNCLEYHRDSEVNIGTTDFILLLAKISEIEDGRLNTGKVKAFKVPAGTAVEVYATTLHYAPCGFGAFRVAVVLPKGTNTEAPVCEPKNAEDRLLRARNKWLLAHPDSAEAKSGAYIGLYGPNIDICK